MAMAAAATTAASHTALALTSSTTTPRSRASASLRSAQAGHLGHSSLYFRVQTQTPRVAAAASVARGHSLRAMASSNVSEVTALSGSRNTSTQGEGAKQALISLSDKRDVEVLAKGLTELGYNLVSTGGTASALEQAGYTVTRVEELTSFPEMLDGRVKTLHPAVHGGILARRDLQPHMDALQQHGIGTIDVVVVNLYPFFSTVTSTKGNGIPIDFEKGVENIDIGGPAMLRAAAKNHKDVMVVVDPEDYPELLAKLQGEDGEPMFEGNLHGKLFNMCPRMIQLLLNGCGSTSERMVFHDPNTLCILDFPEETNDFPPSLTVPLSLKSKLRYGENPHQRAAFYEDNSLSEYGSGGIATSVQYHGKEMSYNNYLDADAAWNCVCEFNNPTCVVVKHTNPCGVASVGPNTGLLEAYRLAVRADPVSAFGGIVAFNVEVDETLAKEIREFRSPTDGDTRMFYEIVVAPSYTEKGLEILKGKSKTLRILKAEHTKKGRRSLRQIGGGWLLQDSDDLTPEDLGFRVVTSKVPTLELVDDAQFAWLCCKHVKSNAIVVAKDNRMLGMGSGQPNRVKSLQIALEKAGEEAKGAALASDAFFPFAWNDAVEDACKAGVKVIAQPGGSMRDQDAIDCCNKYGVAMLFTEVRHFRH